MARVPYGYRIEGDDQVIDAEQAETVRRIFSEFCRPHFHTGLSEIARDLNTDEVPTQRPGGRWYASTIKYVLSNATYAEAPHAIITIATFDQAQDRLASLRMGPTR